MFACGATPMKMRRNHERASFVVTTVSDMTTPPFGFGFGGVPGDGDLSAQMPLFAELQKLLSWQGGPVNWDLAKQLAVQTLSASVAEPAEGDAPAIGFTASVERSANAPVGPAEQGAIEGAVQLADLWLDEVTVLPSGVHQAKGWTRLEWIEQTLPVWAKLVDPVAEHVVGAMGSAVPEEQVAAMGGSNPIAAIMGQVGGLMFGAQVGQGLGGLAQEVISASDIGIPLGPTGIAALVPQNVDAFAEGLERPDRRSAALLGASRGGAPTPLQPRSVAACSACSAQSTPTRAASRSTSRRSSRRWARSIRPTRRASRTR